MTRRRGRSEHHEDPRETVEKVASTPNRKFVWDWNDDASLPTAAAPAHPAPAALAPPCASFLAVGYIPQRVCALLVPCQPGAPTPIFGPLILARTLSRIIHKPRAPRRRLGPNRLRWRLRSPLNVATATLSGLACRRLVLRADTVPGGQLVQSALRTEISESRFISMT